MKAAAFAINRNGNPWIAKISNDAFIDEDFSLFSVLDVDSILFAKISSYSGAEGYPKEFARSIST